MMDTQTPASPFRLNTTLSFTRFKALDHAITGTVEHSTGLRALENLYRSAEHAPSYIEFTGKLLSSLGIRHNLYEQAKENVPQTGGAVVVANHPFGIIDGVILANVILAVRPDVKILTNHLLQRVPEVKDLFIGVDPFGGDGSKKRNITPLLSATRWVKQGGLLIVFPAGEVSHLNIRARNISDPIWSATVGRIIRLTQAPVVPTFFHGSNSLVFQLAGLIHPRLRTALLPREVGNKSDRYIQANMGKVIPWHKLKNFKDDQSLIDHLRFRTYLLGERNVKKPVIQSKALKQPIDAPAPDVILSQEISRIQTQCLLKQNNFSVYYAESKQIPWIMQEIGRLREITFRATGEGTGNKTDIDIFDNHYHQLFIWDHHTNQIVGAYRLGLTDKILTQSGIKGLYSHTLFRYKARIFREMNPAIELGRSFIRQEYQRSFAPLLLLWKGIGNFVAQNPQYRILFGPVSISNDYETTSQKLLVEFLRLNHLDEQLSNQVKPRRPFRVKNRAWKNEQNLLPPDLETVSEVIAGIEQDHKGVPVLLRQYLKLGGRILGFNVDQDFSDSLDGLIMVDLLETDQRVLEKYMGKSAATAFLEYHGQTRSKSA